MALPLSLWYANSKSYIMLGCHCTIPACFLSIWRWNARRATCPGAENRECVVMSRKAGSENDPRVSNGPETGWSKVALIGEITVKALDTPGLIMLFRGCDSINPAGLMTVGHDFGGDGELWAVMFVLWLGCLLIVSGFTALTCPRPDSATPRIWSAVPAGEERDLGGP